MDDLELVRDVGALGTANLAVDAATFGEVIRNERASRTAADDITIYTPVGLPWLDLALAWTAYEAAETGDIGTVIDLLS